MRKTFIAEADIEGHRFVTFGEAEGVVKATASAEDKVIGVTNFIGAEKDRTVDVDFARVAEIKLAGTVAQGDDLAAAADGCAAKCGNSDTAVAVALAAGVKDDIIHILVK